MKAEFKHVPAVSIILPVFKPHPEYLREALASLRCQTFGDFECLCIYDAPEPHITEILAAASQTDPRIRVVEGNNGGLIEALNCGLGLARGDFVARMDADDVSLPNRLERQLQLMQAGQYDIVGGHYFVIDTEGHFLSARVVPMTPEEIAVTMASTVPFAHPSVMIRREFLRKASLVYGAGKYKVAEDYQLWAQMFERGARFGNVDDWIMKYRWVGNSLTRRKEKENRRDRFAIRDEFISNQRTLLKAAAISLAKQKINNPEVEENLCLLAWKLATGHGDFKPLVAIRNSGRRSLATGTLRFFVERN